MKAKAIMDFSSRFGVKISLNPDFIVAKSGRYFLLNATLKPLIRQDFYYAGAYLGKLKGGKFFPSFNLLAMLAECEANRVMVDGKAAWLFICGRDVFRKGVLRVYGSAKKNSDTLVLNEFGECLGFGRIMGRFEGKAMENEVAVRNVSDVGDFLRRERRDFKV